MASSGRSQSILITGESGAGKTETTKFVMKYLAGLGGGTGMEDRVLETNPILEAFGNAKTVHNKNSSRFGKLIEIYFNRSRTICGALIQTYLLEKSRVVRQLAGERGFHIFYQLCAGAGDEERAECRLPPPAEALQRFAYLRGSGCTEIAGVDDAAAFAEVQHAMCSVGITDERQRGIWRVLAAVLWLGNVSFAPVGDTDTVHVAGEGAEEALKAAAALLAVPPGALTAALTTRRMVAGGERIIRVLSMEAAGENRDALAKALYEALFRWLVNQINGALASGGGAAASSLSLLDIYGFECFGRNSFEQLCINYANERLQQQFAAHLFKLEQAAYEEEGVDWAHVDFVDNQECVNLIEARPPAGTGLLSLLDEECLFPKGSDSSFAAKLRHAHASHPRFSADANRPGDHFTLRHYAGEVPYDARTFLDKNRDALSPDLVAALAGAGDALVVALAGEVAVGQERRGSQTVGARFRDQLRDLIARLDRTSLHFVRCIKPNSRQQPSCFNSPLALHQLRCCGILEVARIARAGYPTRHSHQDFAQRYRLLLPDADVATGALPAGVSALDVCMRLLEHFGVDPSLYQVGRTKLFFRAGVLGQLEDRAARVQRSVLTVQSTWRMALCRRAFLAKRAAAAAVQAHWRGLAARREVAELRRRHAAAVVLQAAFRAAAARHAFLRVRTAAVCIQSGWRRAQLERRLAARLQDLLRAEEEQRAVEEGAAAELAAYKAAQHAEQESYDDLKHEFGVDGAKVREVLALWRDQGHKFEEYLAWTAAGGAAAAAVAGGAAAVHERVAELEGQLKWYGELKAEAEELREENMALLQQRAATLAAAAADGGGKRPVISMLATTGDGEVPDSARPSDDGSDDSVSIMSYSAEEMQSESTPGTRKAAGRSTATSRAPTQMPFGRAGAAGAVAALNAELDKKASVFDDDAAFIREVQEGASAAPAMDPDYEMRRLAARFKAWHKDFRVRLKATQQSVKRQHQHSPAGSGGSSGFLSGVHGGNESTLTSRFMSFARGSRGSR